MWLESVREEGTIVLRVGGTIEPADDLADLYARFGDVLREDGGTSVVCDLDEVVQGDLVVVELLARLALTAQRAGLTLRVRHLTEDLEALLAFLGLSEVLDLGPA